MDPDAALRVCLDPASTPAERNEHALALLNWLKKGGFPPSEATVREMGGKRGPLMPVRPRCRLYLERDGERWVLAHPGYTSPRRTTFWRLRKENR